MLEAIKLEPNFDQDIYLSNTTNVLMERIKNRNRDGEIIDQ